MLILHRAICKRDAESIACWPEGSFPLYFTVSVSQHCGSSADKRSILHSALPPSPTHDLGANSLHQTLEGGLGGIDSFQIGQSASPLSQRSAFTTAGPVQQRDVAKHNTCTALRSYRAGNMPCSSRGAVPLGCDPKKGHRGVHSSAGQFPFSLSASAEVIFLASSNA